MSLVRILERPDVTDRALKIMPQMQSAIEGRDREIREIREIAITGAREKGYPRKRILQWTGAYAP
jgi:hypothetical protein